MPPIKLSKVTITPPKPRPTPVSDPLPGAPAGFDPAPPPPVGPPVVDTPVAVDPPVGTPDGTPVGTPDDAVGETFALRARTAAPAGDVDAGDLDAGEAEIPTALVERLLRAVDLVPGLTLATALTLALEQFLATIPADYTRED